MSLTVTAPETREPYMSEMHEPVSASSAVPVVDPDTVIDRAFLMNLAQVPFIAAIIVGINYLAHLAWPSLFGSSGPNYAPLIVICAGMVLAAVIDGWAFKVPNWLTLSLVVSGWVVALMHTCGVAVDAGQGGIGYSLLCTLVGFLLLFPLLAIIGMGQGDVKMLMAFGSWMGAYFGSNFFNSNLSGLYVLVWAFCIGGIVGGIFGIVMMITRGKFKENAANFKGIFGDIKVMATEGGEKMSARANERRRRWDKLPYGVPLCVGFLGYLAYLKWIQVI